MTFSHHSRSNVSSNRRQWDLNDANGADEYLDAHAYYIRRCFHNWTDAHCLKILQQIAPAMAPDSRVLIGEMVVPEYGSERPGNVEDMAPYWMDHAMFTFGGRERTETEWKKLFEGAGLKLVKIWRSHAGSQTVLEARLVA